MISVVVISKDEASLDTTLDTLWTQTHELEEDSELVVVDASEGRLAEIQARHQDRVNWIQFRPPAGVRISIPHQRNVGVQTAKGDIIVFTDAGCEPSAGWLAALTAPLRMGENVTCGLALATEGSVKLYDRAAIQAMQSPYLVECSTINLAFRRGVYDKIGGFDESFAYGSDLDFSWRIVDAGYRIRGVPEAVVRHDWGTGRRQRRRSYVYGRARARLYRKHRSRLRHVLSDDPLMVVYPLYILGLPLSLIFPLYPALLLIPAWRNRADGPVHVIITDRLIVGWGILAEVFQL